MKKWTTESFIEKSKQIHGEVYDYSKTVYTNFRNKITITCPIHGDFEQTVSNHIHKQYGCPKCGIEKRARSRQLSLDDFIHRANQVHNNKYDYSKVVFKNMHQKVTIICPEHGEFDQTPQKHILRQHGCPKCNQSKGEKDIQKYLEQNNIKYLQQFKISVDQSINVSGKAFIDFYLPDYNVFIEYNGIQHYEYTPYFHSGGAIDFEKQQQRDLYIEKYCKEKDIKLIQISYQDNIVDILETWRQDR